MKLSVLALLPFVASPATSFSMLKRYDFPRLSTFFDEIDDNVERDWPSTFFEKQMERMNKEMKEIETGLAFRRASPKYEVVEDDNKFQVTVETPGFTQEEISVDLKDGGRVLSITGEHKEEEEGRSMSSKFQQSFSLDPTVETSQITANLSDDGTLVVSAPRQLHLPEMRKIPVIGAESEETSETKKKAAS
mmetsp:Transcript_19586/g.36741  ORF Transcript_19586/g.36741 Transcript_19586/m.36741 type:complete len:191 (-) Transcript_19586:1470-2042(-)